MKTRKKGTKQMTLSRWLIKQTNTPQYRTGALHGQKHPQVDQALLNAVGGLSNLRTQAREMEQDASLGGAGLIWFDWEDLDADIRQINYAVDIVPVLCKKEGIPDPRQRQQDAIIRMEKFLQALQKVEEPADNSDGIGPDFAISYVKGVLAQLKKGDTGALKDLEDDGFLRCLYTIATMKEPAYRRMFSINVFNKSKTFEQQYQNRIISIIKEHAGLEEEMNKDELLAAVGILTYSQTLECKGPLVYRFPETGATIDTTDAFYGTVLNAQTLTHARPVALPGVRRVMTIENKATYEQMTYDPETLYVYCHGFFSPKEIRFLSEVRDIAEPGTRYFHWGDMDYGGIRIFRFIEEKLFPGLEPYNMGPEEFARIAGSVGIPIKEEKKEKLKRMDAGRLEPLKACILESGLEIEQEQL